MDSKHEIIVMNNGKHDDKHGYMVIKNGEVKVPSGCKVHCPFEDGRKNEML